MVIFLYKFREWFVFSSLLISQDKELTGKQPYKKSAIQEDNRKRKQPYRKTSSLEDNLHWNMALTKENNKKKNSKKKLGSTLVGSSGIAS